ncbi:MAG: LysR family transcriptional regulator [Sneathiella sp.]|nr:LysR family transcriptional regulator [Sneathiella sp.]
MDWKNIPSLAALRAFEATARNGSYVRAAVELNVTEAALRQHVRALEAFFDIALMKREGRGISVTPKGSELSVGLSGGFQEIKTAVEQLRRGHREGPVRVALTLAFAENWLIRRLPEFWAENPDIEIDLAPSIKSVDLAQGNYDLAIRYGTGKWEKYESQMLTSAEYTVVVSPSLSIAKSVPMVKMLKDAIWLFEESREEHREWSSRNGIDFDAERNRFYPNNSLVLSAVRAGHGVSVQSHALVENDLSTGTLVSVFRDSKPQLGYYLLYKGGLKPSAKIFANWLKKCVDPVDTD